MFKPNHQHMLVNATIHKPPLTIRQLNEWLRKLVESIGMKTVAGPTSVRVEECGNEGVTGTITLATSHVAIHVWEKENPPYLKLDVYSCKTFDKNTVLDALEEFGLEHYNYLMLDRNGLNFVLREHATGTRKGNDQET
jgi:S-adenosylmethionine/arginine decarboxylase-like enzyme